jgi:hypothetical protein
MNFHILFVKHCQKLTGKAKNKHLMLNYQNRNVFFGNAVIVNKVNFNSKQELEKNQKPP